MAVADFFGGLKNKVRSVYNNFFYDGGEAPAPQSAQEYAPAQEQPYAPQQPQASQWQQPYVGAQQPQQAAYQQPYQPQPAYQQPYQQSVYQQPAYQTQPEAQPQPRTRRMQHHSAQQQDNNVVDFGAYQQRQQPQPQAQPAPQAAPEAQGQQQTANLLSARVINARGMADCRSAITLLRSGDAVMIVLENITDPTEMRRLVDTLSGACYSLTATITKVSRHGVYLLAPQTLAVYTDQATNAMNSAPARPQARNYQPGYTGQRVAYSSQPMQQPQPQMQPQENPYAGQQGFTQRAAMPEEEPRNFYQRPMPQSAQTPSFSAQPVSYGYAPDEAAAGDQ